MPVLFRLSILSGVAPVVERHLKRGVDPDGCDAAGNTALVLAASRGRTEVCRLLLDAGADLERVAPSGVTARTAALAAGHADTVELLDRHRSAEPSSQMPSAIDDLGPAVQEDFEGLWEADGDVALPAGDADLIARAAEHQRLLSEHRPQVEDQDWSDIVVDLPVSRRRSRRDTVRGRDSVRFRRLRAGVVRSPRPAPQRLEDAVIALDLSKSPDQLLREISIAQVIRSADTSTELRKCVSRSRLFDMKADAFLADDDGEAHFLDIDGFETDDYLELADLMNAFTLLVHSQARHDADGLPDHAPPRTETPAVENSRAMPHRRSPDEILNTTSLGQIVLNAAASVTLRKALTRTEKFDMSAAAFLQEEDGEAIFREEAGLSARTYIELADLVNEFTSEVYRDAGRV